MTNQPSDEELLRFVAGFAGWKEVSRSLLSNKLQGAFRDATEATEVPNYLASHDAFRADVMPKIECQVSEKFCKQFQGMSALTLIGLSAKDRCLALYLNLDGKLPGEETPAEVENLLDLELIDKEWRKASNAKEAAIVARQHFRPLIDECRRLRAEREPQLNRLEPSAFRTMYKELRNEVDGDACDLSHQEAIGVVRYLKKVRLVLAAKIEDAKKLLDAEITVSTP